MTNADADTPPRICFVTGVGRSGTTAMAGLLNRHPSVCIGVERYKFKFLREDAFDAADFTQARFFDFRPGDSNIFPSRAPRWEALYDRLRQKFPQARVVGDKIPGLHQKFDSCSRTFPEAKWIYMLRDVNAVASSWNARAQDPNDKWPATNDFRAAVQAWNDANALVAALPEERVKVLHYEAFFGGSAAERRALLEFLDLPETARFTAAAQASCRKYAEVVKTKTPVVLEGQQEHIAAHADMATYAALIARSRPPGRLQRLRAWLPWRRTG